MIVPTHTCGNLPLLSINDHSSANLIMEMAHIKKTFLRTQKHTKNM